MYLYLQGEKCQFAVWIEFIKMNDICQIRENAKFFRLFCMYGREDL